MLTNDARSTQNIPRKTLKGRKAVGKPRFQSHSFKALAFPPQGTQFEAENSGLPPESLMSAAQTFWIAVMTLAGIGT